MELPEIQIHSEALQYLILAYGVEHKVGKIGILQCLGYLTQTLAVAAEQDFMEMRKQLRRKEQK